MRSFVLFPLAAAVVTAVSARPAHAQSAVASGAVPAVPPAVAARVRADSARLPYTAADVAFMSMMIGHHAQAVEMSRLAPSRGASPAVRTLAERIINAQRDEIATMQRWLRDRGKPVPAAPNAEPTPGPAADPHAGHDMGHAGHASHGASGSASPAASPSAAHGSHDGHARMPGMLSAAQMRELAAARGPDFDRLFLRYMIQHHQGATSMVKDLFGTPGAGQDELVFKFASDVNVDQTTEIARMQRMLVALLFEGPPPAP